MEAKDLTEGSIKRNLIGFSIPYLLSYFLQILYGMVDLYIIGQYCGVESITAVSIGSQIMHMLTVIIIGLAMGTTVVVGQAIGAHNGSRVAAVVGNTITLFLAFSLFLTIVLLAGTTGIVSLIETPAEAVSGTVDYLRICFTGIPFIVAYNIIASIFRGLGDSRSPMYFIAVACVANIILDIVFIGMMDMGAAGAAWGTVLSQTLSVVVSLVMVRKRHTVSVSKTDLKPRREEMKSVLKIGIPIALQDGFIQVSFIVITVIANMRGLTDAAAVGVVEKIIGALFLVPSAMLSAVSAIGAQNIGAHKMWRAKRTLWDSIVMAVGYGLVVSVVIQFVASDVVGIFTDDADVIKSGSEYLRSYIWDTGLAGIHFCFSGFFCACGVSIISFVHNIIAIVTMRIPFSYLLSVNYPDSLFPMGIATPMGSLISVIVCIGFYIWMSRKGKLE
jgi:putative MATE family efflux protein